MDSDTPTDRERAVDERAIRAVHGQVLDAWGAGNGKAFAASFSDDALFIGFDGSVMRGREQIASTHQDVFDRWMKGTRLVEEQTEVRFVDPDVAIVHTLGGTVMPGKSEPTPERDSIQTLVAVRDAGGWSFVSFQNTRIRPIGAGAVSALLWLVPDRLGRLLFSLSKTAPRKVAGLGQTSR
jgi:uncharacterized protein (TIGR02246 family)